MPPIKSKQSIKNRNYWRSLYDSTDATTETEQLDNEFPHGREVDPNSVSRREFLRLMGASMALAGATTGCRRPVRKIVPYVKQPEEIIPGIPLNYATTMTVGDEAFGLLVESHEGRPTKIEGNPQHPSSLGKAGTIHQASILGLYDPDRSKNITQNKSAKSWTELLDFWAGKRADHLANKGEELAILSESFVSPSLSRLKNEFKKNFPNATWATYEPVSNENIYKGVAGATGESLRPDYRFNKADVVLSLDSDFLLTESDSVINAGRFAQARRVEGRKDTMNRLYVAESAFSTTGAMADHRVPVHSAEIGALVGQLSRALAVRGVKVPDVKSLTSLTSAPVDDKWISTLAGDLVAARGRSLIVAGRKQPGAVHALVFALNSALGNVGRTVTYTEPKDAEFPNRESLSGLVARMNVGAVSTLIILGGDPVYNAPADSNFETALSSVPLTMHLSSRVNETSKKVDWHIPQAHFLESWSDARSTDGTVSIVQPLIAPLFKAYTALELISLITTGKNQPGYEIVRSTWSELLGPLDYEKKWRRVLHDGLLKNSALPQRKPKLNIVSLARYLENTPPLSGSRGGVEIVFLTSPTVYDGRYANVGWLQELPDPITKLVWDNVATISPATARKLGVDIKRYGKLGVKKYETVKLTINGNTLELPVFVVAGQADDSVSVYLGYGQESIGKIGNGVGGNVYPLRTLANPDFDSGLAIEKTGNTFPLSLTQDYHRMEGRPLIREATLEEYRETGKLEPPLVKADLKPLWKERKYESSPQWGMAIDLNVCTGCNACTIACQSENNIPVVGKKDAGYGREMHWIRLDRYFFGDEANPQIAYQPVPCMHCENAPCEQVCPVQATNHDKEGLNVMVYNRCIGTRYCSNNCNYKVRRFNFFNYTKDTPEIQKMGNNPDVTIRFRGVMEKCTYCTQRINQAKIKSKVNGTPLKDGDIKTACQQTCPVDAIVFGDISDEKSAVTEVKNQDRDYVLLGEWHTKPRTSYQGKLRNPNPDLG